MPLPEIAAALRAAAARLDTACFDARLAVLEQLDLHLMRADSERQDAVIAYYRDRVDGALAEIETWEVTAGVAVWKLYSSALVVKTPQVTFGVDLCEGPNEDMYGRAQVPFCLTDTQRQRLARCVDYSFHTHHHYDHVSHALVAAMAARGTPVLVTRQHAGLWAAEPFARQLVLLEPAGEPVQLGPLVVRTYHGHQGSDECNAFLIRTDSGVSIWVKGDIYDGDEHAGYLGHLAAAGETVHLCLASTWTKRGADIVGALRHHFDPVFVPCHEWEFTHRGAGKAGVATQSYGVNAGCFAADKSRAAILSWGDRLLLKPGG